MENQEQNQASPAAQQPENYPGPIVQPPQIQPQPILPGSDQPQPQTVPPQVFQPTNPNSMQLPDQAQQPMAQPISSQPTGGFVSQPTSYSDSKKSKGKGTLITIIVIIILLLAAGAAAWYFYFNKPTAEQLYQEAFANALTTTKEKKYAELNISTDHLTFKGGLITDTSDDSSEVSANVDVNSVVDKVPLDLNCDVISINNNRTVDSYLRLNSFTSANWAATNLLDELFAKTKGKWVKEPSEAAKNDQSDASFTTDGPTAAVGALDIVAPFATVSASDKATFLSAAKADNLFTIKKGIDDTQFRGQSARLVDVSVNKSGLEKFNNDVTNDLSSKANDKKLNQDYINALFGGRASLPFKIYIAKSSAQIVGVEYTINFAKPIAEKEFNTDMSSVDVAVLISDVGNHKITAPAHYVKS